MQSQMIGSNYSSDQVCPILWNSSVVWSFFSSFIPFIFIYLLFTSFSSCFSPTPSICLSIHLYMYQSTIHLSSLPPFPRLLDPSSLSTAFLCHWISLYLQCFFSVHLTEYLSNTPPPPLSTLFLLSSVNVPLQSEVLATMIISLIMTTEKCVLPWQQLSGLLNGRTCMFLMVTCFSRAVLVRYLHIKTGSQR